MAKKPKPPPTLADKRAEALRKDRKKYSAKRQSILRAAGPVLQRHGLSGTTIDAIAKEAGVDRATIYYYFKDKHAIFHEAIHGGVAEMVAALEEVAASGDEPEARLRRSIHVVMQAFEKHYPQLYLFFKDGTTSLIFDNELYSEIVASGRRYEDLVEATVRDGIAAGVIRVPLPPKVFAKLLVGMLNWTSWWFVPGGPLTADDVAEGMADVVLNGALVRQPPLHQVWSESGSASSPARERPSTSHAAQPGQSPATRSRRSAGKRMTG
jgi:AcrR family transcriptional regulator